MKLIERQGSLFETMDNLAHCVSADFHMSAGIAVQFRDRFQHKLSLLEESWGVGQVARRRVGNYYVFYMVTKPRYFQKPTYHSLGLALVELAKWCELLGLQTLSIPPISCCRDKLKWPIVRQMIMKVFNGLGLTITVYH